MQLRMTKLQHQTFYDHLFPGDGKEAVALALCGRLEHNGLTYLLVHQIHLISYSSCSVRTSTSLKWSTDSLHPMLELAMKKNYSILKIHSHPNDQDQFSPVDDVSDRDLFESVSGWLEKPVSNGSAIMTSDGSIKYRIVTSDIKFIPGERVTIIGDEIVHYDVNKTSDKRGFTLRHAQMFGEATTSLLDRLKIGIVGTSGTGSVVAELLNRLGVGNLILADPDTIEEKNLNRIVNSRKKDIGKSKTECLKNAIENIDLGTQVTSIPYNLNSAQAVKEIAACDFVFGCVDGAEGRSLLNRICAFYLVPYIDVGVRLDADGCGGIDQICGSIHYLKPGGSTLLSRGAITSEQIRAEAVKRTDPERYEEELKEGYIKGIAVDRPAVVSINTFYASMAVNEFLARIHPYRHDPNSEFAHYSISLAQMFLYPPNKDGEPDQVLAQHLGRGDVEPLLNMPSLSIKN